MAQSTEESQQDCGAVRLADGVDSRAQALRFHVLNNQALAEEVAQDVFVETWNKAANFDQMGIPQQKGLSYSKRYQGAGKERMGPH